MSEPMSINTNAPNYQRELVPNVTKIVTDAVPTPSTLLAAAQKSLAEMNLVASYVAENTQSEDNNTIRIQLTPPRTSAEKVADGDSDTTLLAILMQLQELLGNASVENLKSRIETAKKFAEARTKAMEQANQAYKDALADFEKATKNFGDATLDLNKAKSNLSQSEKDFKAAQAALNASEVTLRKAQAAFDAAPNDPATIKALTEAKRGYVVSQDRLTQMEANLGTAQKNYELAYNNVLTAIDYVNAAQATMTQRSQELPKVIAAMAELKPPPVEQTMSTTALLVQFMLELQRIIGDSNESRLKGRMELYKIQQDSLREQNEIQNEERKRAKEIMGIVNKILGIFAKIIGALMVAWGVLTAIPSGGTSLALAVAGAALFAADLIVVAAGKESFLGKIFEPLTEKILSPIMEKIALLFDKMLEAFGVEDQRIRAIASAVLVLVTTVGAVVGAIFLGQSKLVQQLAEKAANFISKYLIPNFVKTLATMGSEALSAMIKFLDDGINKIIQKVFGEITKPQEWFMNIVNQAMSYGVMPVGTATESTLGSVSAGYNLEVQEAVAEITKNFADLRMIKRQIAIEMTQFSSSLKIESEISKEIATLQANYQNTISLILRNLTV